METETFFKDEFRFLLKGVLNNNTVYTQDEIIDKCDIVIDEIIAKYRITEERYIDD